MSDTDDESPSAEEFLDWLCWMWAGCGERFYPPEETAWECVEVVLENYEEQSGTDEMFVLNVLEAYQWEVGQHSRAYSEAIDKFTDAARWGFNPIEAAAREHRDLMKRADEGEEIDPIDWSWLSDRGEFINSLTRE